VTHHCSARCLHSRRPKKGLTTDRSVAGSRRAPTRATPSVLASASTPDVPFCTAPVMETVVVLARRSVRHRVRVIADSGCAEIRLHTQPLRCPANDMCAGESHLATLLLAKVACARIAQRGHPASREVPQTARSVALRLNPYWRSQTEMCFLLSLVKGARSQSAHRSRNLIPAISAMRSSSAGHAYRNGDSTCPPRPSTTT
jgi:hypothetical protein